MTTPLDSSVEATSFLRNYWYVVAWDHEIPDDALFSRTILGESILLYRTQCGAITALDNKCCHGHAPLSLGRKDPLAPHRAEWVTHDSLLKPKRQTPTLSRGSFPEG
jgi:hypothetical protein